jgi:hypothetical protein
MSIHDVDMLLEELDTILAPKQPVKILPPAMQQHRSSLPKHMTENDLDDLMSDLNPVTQRLKSVHKSSSTSELNTMDSSLSSVKCIAPHLGTSEVKEGQCTFIENRRCNHIRCTKCDFRVVSFDNQEWDESVNYLYFRNNYPETLSKKRNSKRGSSAYCCQCSWISVDEFTRVNTGSFKWICGGHNKS